MTATTIEWADEVWNPVTGCTKVSQGCKHCYAEVIAKRFWGERKFSDVIYHPERMAQPIGWKKPRRVFVNSMSDLFHESVSVEIIANVWAVMAMANQHRYMILTKRAKRMWEVLNSMEFGIGYSSCLRILTDHTLAPDPILDNIWLGVSAETQEEADKRIPLLLRTPAAVRFVSVEPMLGPINLLPYLVPVGYNWDYERRGPARINWVIMGGESGLGARPMHPDWARSVRDQCQDAGVPFFFKQWGEWKPISEMSETENDSLYYPAPARDPEATRKCKVSNRAVGYDGEDHWERVDGHVSYLTFQVGKKAAGRLLDGVEWNREPSR